MGPKPGRSRSRDHGRPLRRLSLAKNADHQGNAKLQKGPSITSFFKNTPPSKLACPLCGKFISRFKINEHIDSQCQDFLEENDTQATSASDNEQVKTSSHFLNNASQSAEEEKNASMHENDQDRKTSPYFKKNGTARQESPKNSSPHAGEPKIVRLGRLSSKLSKKVLFSLEDSKIPSPQTSIKEEPVLSEPSSSQKENFDENVSLKSEQLVMTSALTSQVPSENHFEPCVEEIKQATSKVDSLGPDTFQSANTAASLRLMKRKKEETPVAGVATKMQKKTRFSGKRSAKSASADALPDRSCDLQQDASNSSVNHGSLRRPYYLQNFLTVLGTVLENKDDRALFSEEELSSIQRFKQLSGRECTALQNIHTLFSVHMYVTWAV